MIAGADGYRKQLVVAMDRGEGSTRLELIPSPSDLIRRPDLERLLIDVPIGLPGRGPRTCDVLARKLIGPRRSSVFPAPIRPMLGAASYEEACERRHRVEGKRCSRQLFAILPFIEHVDDQMAPDLQDRIREGHPEVSFTALAGEPVGASKASPEGQAQRRALLRKQFPDLEENVSRFGRPGALTDILDAYALLWSARRLVRGEARTLPSSPERDARGLRMEIVY